MRIEEEIKSLIDECVSLYDRLDRRILLYPDSYNGLPEEDRVLWRKLNAGKVKVSECVFKDEDAQRYVEARKRLEKLRKQFYKISKAGLKKRRAMNLSARKRKIVRFYEISNLYYQNWRKFVGEI